MQFIREETFPLDEGSHDLPFSKRPGRGRRLLGRLSGGNCRHEYGLRLSAINCSEPPTRSSASQVPSTQPDAADGQECR